MDCSPPGSSVRGILQPRILEWVTISFSRGSSQTRDQTRVSCISGKCFILWDTREAPEFNSDDHYIYYCGQESLRINGVAIMVNKSLKCSTLMQSQKLILSRKAIFKIAFWFHMYDVCALVPKLCPTLGHFMIVARQAPIPMEFSRQEYWSGLPFPSPGDLPKPGIFPNQGSNPGLLHFRQMLYPLSHQGSPWI